MLCSLFLYILRALFIRKLTVVEVGIKPALLHQCLMIAALDDIAVPHHKDQIGVLIVERRCAMTKLVRSAVSVSIAC